MDRTTATAASFLILAILAGCALPGTVWEIPKLSDDQVLAKPPDTLCAMYYTAGGEARPDIQARLRRLINGRSLVPQGQWVAIDARKVAVGFTRCAALAAWGSPSQINGTTTRHGRREQWVYRTYYGPSLGYSRGNYLYVEDDLVTAIQN